VGKSLELERALSGVLTLSDLERTCLEGLQDLVGASGVTLFSFEQQGQMRLQGPGADALQEYPTQVFHDDPIRLWNLSLPSTTFLALGHNFDKQQFLRSRVNTDFYVPHEMGRMCGIWPTGLPFGQDRMFGLMVWLPTWSRHFAKVGLQRLEQLEIPLRAAARRIQRFRAAGAQTTVLYELLDRQKRALLLWSPEGQLDWVSPAARVELQGKVRRPELEVAAAAARKQLASSGPAAREAPLGRPRLVALAEGRSLLAELYWVPDADGRPWVVAELSAYGETQPLLEALTKAEMRILRLLADGLSNQEMSDRLHVSIETIKTHVQRVLAKLRVDSRSKAAHLLRQWGTTIRQP
jgi:DNA-binding CsgD family transcriptional regulator